jgi:phage repressor protein C with HTH and peptisase S24 domain
MLPFIQEDDVVLVDLGKNDPAIIVDGKTYTIREDSTVKIKRLVRQSRKLIIRSQDNDNYPDYAVDDDFCLIGRVMWVGHEVK